MTDSMLLRIAPHHAAVKKVGEDPTSCLNKFSTQFTSKGDWQVLIEGYLTTLVLVQLTVGLR